MRQMPLRVSNPYGNLRAENDIESKRGNEMSHREEDVRNMARAIRRMHDQISVPLLAQRLSIDCDELRDRLDRWPALRREFVFTGYRKCTSERYVAAMELLLSQRLLITDARIARICGTTPDAVKAWRSNHRREVRHFYVLTEPELRKHHRVRLMLWIIALAKARDAKPSVDEIAARIGINRVSVFRLFQEYPLLRRAYES